MKHVYVEIASTDKFEKYYNNTSNNETKLSTIFFYTAYTYNYGD